MLRSLTALALLTLASHTLTGQALRSVPKEQILVAAHRGDWHYTPENSLEGIALAKQAGVHILETDVRLTADDSLILMHDYTLERTTTGRGKVEDIPYSQIAELYLRNGQGSPTPYRVPTLSSTLDLAGDKMLIYFDKAHQDPRGKPKGYKIKKILELLRAKGMLELGVFVLSYSYSEAKEIFGDDLERVNYIPVISESIPQLEQYVDEYIQKLRPVAFQFRVASVDELAFKLLPKVKASGSRCFVAATWAHHTAGHDDLVSLRTPDAGWGWLIEQGFDIIETNYYERLLSYLGSRATIQR